MVEFLEKHITTQFKNKLIIMDNASSHRNPRVIKEAITQHNHLLYAVSYQHFTNSIINTITNIPKDKYRNIIKGAYERPEKYVSNKNKTRKIKKNYL